MTEESVGPEGGVGLRDAIRLLRSAGSASVLRALVTNVTGGQVLELLPSEAETPRLQPASPIEGDTLRTVPVEGGTASGFVAFLDGVQQSRVAAQQGAIPLVHGTVAAVVRVRRARKLLTWTGGLRVSRAVYLPIGLLDDAVCAVLRAGGAELVDTSEGTSVPVHPQELLARARSAVQRRRELLETALAERWCSAAEGPVMVDGSISNQGLASGSVLAVGVVKSHRTLYATADTLDQVAQLPVAHRTTAFDVRSPRRTAVASWYLRLHAPRALDPLFGLVRIEVAHHTFTSARADEVSRWVLAERTPVALPDRRWHVMSYGVKDCEAYLRALVS